MKISQFPDGGQAQAGDLVPIVRAGQDYSVKAAALASAPYSQQSLVLSGARVYAGASSALNSYIWADPLTISGQAAVDPGDGVISPFHWYIAGDTVDTTTIGSSLLRMHSVVLGVQAGHTGVRTGVFASVQVVGSPASLPSSGKGHEGVEALCFINANLLGTTGAFANYKGGCYGGNHSARLGPNGTFVAILNGHEFDIAIQSGGSCASKYGTSIVKESIDTVQGVYSDVAHATFDQNGYNGNNVPATSIVAGKSCQITTVGTTDFTLIGSPNNTPGTFFTATGPGTGTGVVQVELPPWNYVYAVGGYSSQWPCDATSTLIFAYQRQIGTPAAMPATAMQANGGYKIASVGTTNYTSFGSPNNTVGTIFIATGPATGTGTVTRGYSVANIGLDYTNVVFKTMAIQTPGFSVNPFGGGNFSNNPATGGTGLTVTGTFTGAASYILQVLDVNNTNGAGMRFSGNGGATPTKVLRAHSGDFEVLNDAQALMVRFTDAGTEKLVGALGVNNNNPPAQVTGWGSPVGAAVINNYNITDAGGANSNTNKALAQIIADLKAIGFYAA